MYIDKYDLVLKLREILDEYKASSKRVNHGQAGILYIGENFILSDTPRLADYYLGFEYIDSYLICSIEDSKIYFTEEEGDRVDSIIQRYAEEDVAA